MTTVDNHHIGNNHSSPVGSIQVTDNDSSIKNEDGKVVVDEEIDSCEGEDYDEKMFQVALVNSVMDTGGNGNATATQQSPGEMSPRSKARHALRKRRRPGDEAAAASPAGVLGPVPGNVIKSEPDIDIGSNLFGGIMLPNDPLNELQHVQDNSISIPLIQQPVPTPLMIKQEPLPPILYQQPVPTPAHNAIKMKQEPQQQHSTGNTARGHSQSGIISKPLSSSPALLPSITAPVAQQRQQQSTTKVVQAYTKNTILASSAKPSNTKKKAPRKRKPKPPKVTTKTKVASRLSMPVPNPLLASTPPTHPSLNHSVLNGRQGATVASASSVPCPLPLPSPFDTVSSIGVKPPEMITSTYIPPFDPTKMAKLSEYSENMMEHPGQSRTRVFSIDLDPSTFDFSDLSSLTGGDNKLSSDSDLPIFQSRDRAFSFEVFNFAGGDDLLPNPVSSSSMLQAPSLAPVSVEAPTSRPRGDSIIFDPASFQDGGIHEKNALEKARLKELLQIAPPQQSLPHPVTQRGGITGTFSTSQSNNPLPLLLPPGPSLHSHTTPIVAGQNRVSHPVLSKTTTARTTKSRPVHSGSRISSSNKSHSVHIATLPSSLSSGASNAQSPPTFQMELLNKDGRIGIYLPEARRLRIARFHAKRKMRIWRKRIKYDCRKKLADSRPRIKGRFVKRSDV